jgi:hypothetical protein
MMVSFGRAQRSADKTRRFQHPSAEPYRWHVDCIDFSLVNEDCGPPDVEAIVG